MAILSFEIRRLDLPAFQNHEWVQVISIDMSGHNGIHVEADNDEVDFRASGALVEVRLRDIETINLN